jgi:hypothetical protein
MPTLAQRAQDELREALIAFGEYSYNDKGPAEVMDIDSLASAFRDAGPDAAVDAFRQILTDKDHGESLASAILYELQDWTELWNLHEEFLATFY